MPRRSVYGFIERGRVPALLNAFDFASPDQHAPMRFVTTVPQQALFFLNSPFVAEQARHLAARAEMSERALRRTRFVRLYRFVFSRDAEELGARCGPEVRVAEERELAQAGSGGLAVAVRVGETPLRRSLSLFPTGGKAARSPCGRFGKAILRAAGGEPGERLDQAVVRRWVSPVSGQAEYRRHASARPTGGAVWRRCSRTDRVQPAWRAGVVVGEWIERGDEARTESPWRRATRSISSSMRGAIRKMTGSAGLR